MFITHNRVETADLVDNFQSRLLVMNINCIFFTALSVVESARHLADARRNQTSSLPTVNNAAKAFVGPQQTGSFSTVFQTAAAPHTAIVPRIHSGNMQHVNQYHTLATFAPSAKRSNQTFSIGLSTADVRPLDLPRTTRHQPMSSTMKHFDLNKFGDSSSTVAAVVGGSPRRYPLHTGIAARGQTHRQAHRNKVKMSETVSDMNLARHLATSAPLPNEQLYATVDRASSTANSRRHLVAKYGGTAISGDGDRGNVVTSSVQLGKSLEVLPDTTV